MDKMKKTIMKILDLKNVDINDAPFFQGDTHLQLLWSLYLEDDNGQQ
tara:strand:+ start:382 stop:522 length:141 start_codon:yes stop_codon:yes gene_type:complete